MKYKQCHNGHYYEGDTCPYCPTQYYPVGDTEIKYKSVVPPTMTQMGDIPLCPHCGSPVRKYVPMSPKGVHISSIKNMGDGIVPWNYQWDGKCENCGHDFNIVMRIDMGSTGPDNKVRETKINVNSKGFLHHITCDFGEWRSTVLSGVEIETHCGLGNEREKLFLSANELKYLMKVLQNSPILKQFDYYTEDVERNSVRT